MFRRLILPALVLAALPLAPGHADVLAGVTAWESGDYDRAVREWRPEATAGDPDAQFNLGQAYKLGRGVPQDLAEASQWFRRAAAQNHLQAEDNLGLVLYDMGQKGEAIPLLLRSAGRGEPRAQFVMGAELFNGERVSRDLPRAYAFMKRASDAGLQRASAALAQMDGAMPLEQRRQGLALAREMETSEPQTRLAAASGGERPAPRPEPTVRPTALPPSAAGTTYPAPGQAARATTPAPAVPAAQPSPARTQPATAASQGNWRIQLGAFSQRARAEALWSSLSGRLPGAAPDYVAAGAVTRLQAGPYASRAEADRACAAVRPNACFAVAR